MGRISKPTSLTPPRFAWHWLLLSLFLSLLLLLPLISLCLNHLYPFLRYLCPSLVVVAVPVVAPRTITLLWKAHTLPLPWVELVPQLWDASLFLPWLWV